MGNEISSCYVKSMHEVNSCFSLESLVSQWNRQKKYRQIWTHLSIAIPFAPIKKSKNVKYGNDSRGHGAQNLMSYKWKLKFKEVTWLVQSHTATLWWGQTRKSWIQPEFFPQLMWRRSKGSAPFPECNFSTLVLPKYFSFFWKNKGEK